MRKSQKNSFYIFICLLTCVTTVHAQSTCYGNSAKGRLADAVMLPSLGNNFIAYSDEAVKAGRTYVHSVVAQVVIDTYTELERTQPQKKFKYGESGFATGGSFPPHKTHQNGTSVDFFVPVIDRQGTSVYFKTDKRNRYGYDVEFDAQARMGEFQIDFAALAAHVQALIHSAEKHQIKIKRIILAPEFHKYLLREPTAKKLTQQVYLQKKKSWVRHDEHYHVDFEVPCEPYK